MKSLSPRVVAVVGLLGSLLAACGGSGASKADGGGGNGATACASYVQKDCDRIQACVPGFLQIIGLATLADCAAYYLPACKDALAASNTGDTPALVEQCGDQLSAMSCTEFLQSGSGTACLPHGGTTPNGGVCTTSWQCASGRCSVPAVFLNGSISCGTCVPAVPLGQTCDPNGLLGSDCADNLVCAVMTVGGTTPVCAKSVAIGGACADAAVCPFNAFCDGTTNLCTQLPAVGQSCDPATIYYCDPTKAGALCDSNSSLCQPITVAKAGESCTPLSGDTTVSCLGSCDTPADAGPDAGLGTCSPNVFEGQPCTASDICFVGTSCVGGICTALACGGAGTSGTDAATNAGPRSRSVFARRDLIRMPAVATGPAFWPRH